MRGRAETIAARATLALALAALVLGASSGAASAGGGADIFSIVGLDSTTGELGVAALARAPAVGNFVPWAQAGVGAVALGGLRRIAVGAADDEERRTTLDLGRRRGGVLRA